MGKIILLGLDSATWKEINPLLKDNKLPNFARMKKEGSYGILKPLKYYKSPALWNSVVTGKIPSIHGIEFFCKTYLKIGKHKFDLSDNFLARAYYKFFKLFYRKKSFGAMTFPRRFLYWFTVKLGKVLGKLHLGDNYILTSNDRKTKALWNIFSDNGKKAGMVGWWCSWPAEKVNGFVISEKSNVFLTDMLKKGGHYKASSEKYDLVFPHDILKEVEVFKKNYFSGPKISQFFSNLSEEDSRTLKSSNYIPRNRISLFKYYYNTDSFYFNNAMHFLDKVHPDFLCVYLPGLDPIQHTFWQYNHLKDFKFAKIDEKEIEKFKNAIPQYYIELDGCIGRALEKLGDDDTLIVISDHGMESVPKSKYSKKRIGSGQHDKTPDGIFMIKGKNIKKDNFLGDIKVLDIAPTILFLSGLPLANDMTGEIIEKAISDIDIGSIDYVDSYEKSSKKKETASYSDEEQEKIKERLKDLGYI